MKTEQKMTRAELIKSNEYWQETIENLLYSYDRMEISTNHFKEEILRIRDEYAQQRVREELIKYKNECWSSDRDMTLEVVRNYLNQNKK